MGIFDKISEKTDIEKKVNRFKEITSEIWHLCHELSSMNLIGLDLGEFLTKLYYGKSSLDTITSEYSNLVHHFETQNRLNKYIKNRYYVVVTRKDCPRNGPKDVPVTFSAIDSSSFYLNLDDAKKSMENRNSWGARPIKYWYSVVEYKVNEGRYEIVLSPHDLS